MLKFHRVKGQEARQYADDLARLRLRVFYEFPYLYEGSLDYEKKYLETYFKTDHSFIFLVEEMGKIVGATTGIWAQEEEENFRKPFVDRGLDPKKIFYFGESVLLEEYRGKGLGKKFFEERENFARTLPSISMLSFCAVLRSENHPLRPRSFKPLDPFWKSMGFRKEDGLTTNYEWKDRGELESSSKVMQFWIKHI